MTIAALHRLLNEIDDQGGPTAARHNRLHLPDERTHEPMSTAPAPRPAPPAVDVQLKAVTQDTEQIPVGQLLAWGDAHPDAEVQDQAARARIALHGLRQRHAADQELTAITSEREQLEKRLSELQAREAELAPPKAKKKTPQRDYDPATVRAWAQQAGVDCPDRGRVPKAVVDAWREANRQAGAETS